MKILKTLFAKKMINQNIIQRIISLIVTALLIALFIFLLPSILIVLGVILLLVIIAAVVLRIMINREKSKMSFIFKEQAFQREEENEEINEMKDVTNSVKSNNK